MTYWWQMRYIRRRRQIVGTFFRHGLGYFMQRFGLDKLVPVQGGRGKGRSSKNDYLLARNLREALVELGPTFVKFGQLLSTRPDILPPIYIEELEKLQDKVNPIPYEDVCRVLSKELGDYTEIFSEFDPTPLAAASIGQVHRAKLQNGREVIVKIQRPGIEETVKDDLEIIKGLARRSERRSADARQIGIVAIVNDYARTLLRELDYEREARNTERVYNNFAGDKRVVIPKVYQEFTTPKVLVEDFIPGIKLSDIKAIEERGWSRRKISQLGTEAFLSQILLHGFFQADPHPGNILAVDEDTIAFIDFGEIGYLSDRRLIYLGELLTAINKRDAYWATSILQDMGVIDSMDDVEDFAEEFNDLIERISSSDMGGLDMKRLRTEIMQLSYRYQLRMPAYLTSMMKALITVEGLGKKLDPTFNFTEVASPLTRKVYRERLKPENIARYMRSRYYQDIKPLKDIPANFNRLLRNSGEGRMAMKLQLELSPDLNRKLTQLVSRLSLSLILTGVLIGSALIIQTNHPAEIARFAYLGVAGFAIALFSLIVFLLGSLRR